MTLHSNCSSVSVGRDVILPGMTLHSNCSSVSVGRDVILPGMTLHSNCSSVSVGRDVILPGMTLHSNCSSVSVGRDVILPGMTLHSNCSSAVCCFSVSVCASLNSSCSDCLGNSQVGHRIRIIIHKNYCVFAIKNSILQSYIDV